MANTHKFIVKNGLRADNIEFTDSHSGSHQISLSMLNSDTLNFEGDAGSLFSIADDLTGSVFTVGDISGLPIIDINGDTHNVTFNQFDGKIMIGGTDSGSVDSDILNVTGNIKTTGKITTTDSSIFAGNGSSGGVTISDGLIDIRTGTGLVSKIKFYCEAANAHFQTLQAAPHSEGSSAVIVLPTASGTLLTTNGSAASLSQIPMGEASGTLAAANVGNLPASKITSGLLDSARLPIGVSFHGAGGGGSNATTFTLVATNDTSGTFFPVFVDTATGNENPRTDTGFTYNSSTGLLSAAAFSGSAASMSQIPMAEASGTLGSGHVGNLPASKITSGLFDSARLQPLAINAAYIANGLIDSARLPIGVSYHGAGGGGGSGTATNITVTANNTTNESTFLTFVDGADGTQGIETDTGLTYNPSTGLITLGDTDTSGITAAHYYETRDAQNIAKIRLWQGTTTAYVIGFKNGYTYGGLGEGGANYAMNFTMSNTTGRGFIFDNQNHTDAQGAMAITSDGKVTVAHSIRVGYGEGDTTTPGATHTLDVNGSFAATTKSFVIDHPTKEGMKLRYGSLEGPENGVYLRGRLKDNNTIELPDYWTGLVDEDTITVNLTPIGKHQEIYVEDISDNKVFIGGENINCFYIVYGERKDVDKMIVEYNE